MSARGQRIIAAFDRFLQREKRDATASELTLLDILVTELDDLESRIGSLSERPEEVRELTDRVGVHDEAKGDPV